MVFSELLGQCRDLLEAGTPILLSVDVDRKNEDELRFLAQTIEPLTQAVQNVTHKLHIHASGGEAIGKIKALLERAGQGKVKVSLIVDAGSREAEIELPGAWSISEGMPKSLRAIAGVGDIREF
jgi:DNA polymerase-3 subunit alpha